MNHRDLLEVFGAIILLVHLWRRCNFDVVVMLLWWVIIREVDLRLDRSVS